MGPLFEEFNITVDRSAGLFVEVMHTSAPNFAAVQSPVGMVRELVSLLTYVNCYCTFFRELRFTTFCVGGVSA